MSILKVARMGHPVLRQRARPISLADLRDPMMQTLINDMIDTMHEYSGVGLAAPQVGVSLRLFVVDSEQIFKEDENEEGEKKKAKSNEKGIKQVFINPQIIEETGDLCSYEEGCLSIPGIRSEVMRPEKLRIHYFDENWVEHTEEYDGMQARIIQHEYDHLNGVLYLDRLKSPDDLELMATDPYSRALLATESLYNPMPVRDETAL